MKAIIILLLISFSATAQDTAYDGSIKVPLGDSSDGGYTYKRKGFFEVMTYNQRTSVITIQWRIKFQNNQDKDLKMVQPYSVETHVTNQYYVVSATGEYVGDMNKVLSLYGVMVDGEYQKLPDGRYFLTTKCMGEFDYWMKMFDSNQKLHNMIKAHGLRELVKK